VSAQREERVASGLRVCIDRSLCVGFGDCVEAAPEAFQLDDESIVILVDPERVDRERLLKACDACPVDAITVWGEDGQQLVP
jgi:ferredoxin